MHAFNSLGPWMMFGSVLGHFVNFWNVKKMQNLCVGLECTILRYWSSEIGFAPNASIVLLWTQYDFCKCFATFRMWKDAILVFRAWVHYFGVPILRKWIHTKCIDSNPLDQKWCFAVFSSISKILIMSKDTKLVFRAWMHYLWVPKLQKWVHTKYMLSTPLNLKWCLGVFWSILETFGT
jgi:hypothetical protein